jgi:hypothetical protein
MMAMQQAALEAQRAAQLAQQAADNVAKQAEFEAHKNALFQMAFGSSSTTTSSSSSSHPILASAGSMNSYGNTYNPLNQTYSNTSHKGASIPHQIVYNGSDPVDNARQIRENWNPDLVKASAAHYNIPTGYKTPFLNANGCPIKFQGDLPWEATGAHPKLAVLLNKAHGNYEYMKKSEMLQSEDKSGR